MKTGKSLVELATELERQNEVKRDFIVDTRKLSMVPVDNHLMLRVEGSDLPELTINSYAHRQIGTYTKIPAPYYDRMLEQCPWLLACNVATWFQQEPAERMVRTLDGTTRAFLSNRYRRLDNFEVANAVLPIISTIPDARIESCELTERKMYIKVVNPRLQTDVVPGDTVQAGVVISNSEIGAGSVSVQPLVYRLVCSNGMVVNDMAAKKYHVGRVNEVDDSFELFSDETLQADDKAFILKMQDTVKAAVDEARFQLVVDTMREATGVKITGSDIPAVVELTRKEYGFTQEEGNGILRHLIEGGDLSLYGLANAVTKHAQDVESYDRSTELESAGYSIMTMAPALWQRINSVV